jgi:MFS family permease
MHTAPSTSLERDIVELSEARAVYRKVTWRLLPFLFVCYVFAYLDRANIGFAHLQFSRDVGMSEAAFGLGVGLFYAGYMIFEVPSNLWLQRVGVRRTLLRIMVLWGVVSAGTAFVHTPAQFYLARVLLGAAEAGFFPGVILYFTYWFPAARRARITSIFMTAICVSGIVSGPLSGLILDTLTGIWHFRGWQWMFLLEGLPSIVAGLFAYVYLTDRPEQAEWLSAAEKSFLIDEIKHEAQTKAPKFYILTFAYFSVPWASIVVHIWAPSVIQKSGVTNIWHVGLFSAVPYVVGAAAMYLLGRSSDRMLERRWHFMVSCVLAAVGVALLPLAANSLGLLQATWACCRCSGRFHRPICRPPLRRAASALLVRSGNWAGYRHRPSLATRPRISAATKWDSSRSQSCPFSVDWRLCSASRLPRLTSASRRSSPLRRESRLATPVREPKVRA